MLFRSATLTSTNAGPLTTGSVGAGQTTVNSATATIGDLAARVISSVAEPGVIGRYRVTIVVPDAGSGAQDLVITVAGKKSQTLQIPVGFLFPQPPTFFQDLVAGNYTAVFGLKVKVPDPVEADKEIEEIATFVQPVGGNGCTIAISGSNGPTYSGQVHCQDYSNPNKLIAILMAFRDGRFVDNKLVFTVLQTAGVNRLFYIGSGNTPTRAVNVTLALPITAGAVSLDLKRPDFAFGDTVIGTIHATFAVPNLGTIPSQTVQMGGAIVAVITGVRR